MWKTVRWFYTDSHSCRSLAFEHRSQCEPRSEAVWNEVVTAFICVGEAGCLFTTPESSHAFVNAFHSILDIARSQITCISPIAIGDILKCNNRVSVVALWQTFFKILPIFERKRNHARRAGDVRDNFLSPRFSSSHYRYVDYMWYLERIVYLGGGTARNAQNIPLK